MLKSLVGLNLLNNVYHHEETKEETITISTKRDNKKGIFYSKEQIVIPQKSVNLKNTNSMINNLGITKQRTNIKKNSIFALFHFHVFYYCL